MSNWTGFGDLDLSEIEEDQRPLRLGQGEYDVKVSKAKMEPYTSVNGSAAARLEVEFLSLDRKHYITERYNLHNSNPEAQQIGKSQLKSMLIAAAHPTPDKPSDVSSIEGLELRVFIGMGKPYNDKNTGERKQFTEVKRYMPRGTGASGGGGGGASSLKDDKIPF
jgi:hypothetical protein